MLHQVLLPMDHVCLSSPFLLLSKQMDSLDGWSPGKTKREMAMKGEGGLQFGAGGRAGAEQKEKVEILG